jgi:putative membrane protein
MSPSTKSDSRIHTPIAGIVVVSAIASLFLLWLLYMHHAPAGFADRLTFLPLLNAIFNGLSAIALVTGFTFIMRRRISAHRNSMITAFAFSTLFLLSYITHHALHGEVRFAGTGGIRTFYLWLLTSHVFLSMIALPMILVTFYFSLSGRFPQHRRIARYTFPIWLYVSVTGVIVYSMLAAYK